MNQPARYPQTLEPAGQWLKSAACKADPEAMFPSSLTTEIEYAKGYCRSCPVLELCGQWALEHGEEYGVWGGLSEAERRSILRRRHKTASRISTDDYTGTPGILTRGRTLQEAWDEGTQADGEHVRWVGSKTVHRTGDRAVTPNRLAFYLDRGHWPEGDVKRLCQVEGCVRPAHLADRRERAEVVELAAAA
ncbi:WhiB family transcriptional regulator [Streptomyces aureus]